MVAGMKDVVTTKWRISGAGLKLKSGITLWLSESYATLCGERGIRTPGTSQYAGFQDRCIRPLCHLSKDSA